jgi:hypothetical protein
MTQHSKTFSKIHGIEKHTGTDTAMLYAHGGDEAGTASYTKCHNIHMSDVVVGGDPVAAVVAFAKRQFRTMGFCFLYAVKGSSVVQLMKQGHFAQRDVKILIAEGYTEFFYSSAFACKLFMLPSGEIVELEKSIDCSPKATTTAALRFGRAMGLV